MRRIISLLVLLFVIALYTLPAKAFLVGGVPTAGGTVPVSCTGYTPPLDSQSGAVAAYSFRLLRTAYSGGNIVTIQRSSDSTQKTFTASLPSCTINTSDAFFDGSTYTIATWYDQSGNGADITQATNGNRPTVTLSCQNSHPCGVYAASSSQRLAGTLASGVTNTTYAVVAEDTSQSTSEGMMGVTASSTSAVTDGTFLGWSLGSVVCFTDRVIASSGFTGKLTCANNTWFRWAAINNGTLSRLYLNGTQGTDDTSTQTIGSENQISIGSSGSSTTNATTFWTGKVAEAIVFAPDLSPTNALLVSTNQGTYWGI